MYFICKANDNMGSGLYCQILLNKPVDHTNDLQCTNPNIYRLWFDPPKGEETFLTKTVNSNSCRW